MIFISFWFYIFVAVLVSVYYLLPLRFRWVSLLIGSLGFYWYLSQSSPGRFFALVALALISWLLGKALGKDHKYRKALLTVSVLSDAIPLVGDPTLAIISSNERASVAVPAYSVGVAAV